MVRQVVRWDLAFLIAVEHRSLDDWTVDDRLCLSSLWPSSLETLVLPLVSMVHRLYPQ